MFEATKASESAAVDDANAAGAKSVDITHSIPRGDDFDKAKANVRVKVAPVFGIRPSVLFPLVIGPLIIASFKCMPFGIHELWLIFPVVLCIGGYSIKKQRLDSEVRRGLGWVTARAGASVGVGVSVRVGLEVRVPRCDAFGITGRGKPELEPNPNPNPNPNNRRLLWVSSATPSCFKQSRWRCRRGSTTLASTESVGSTKRWTPCGRASTRYVQRHPFG